MRVIAGSARSLPLKTPAGMGTRPTTDRIKETLFNMLQPYIGGCVFVDLFSGSGAIGIEALSRGAARAYFVENDRRVIKCIEENLKFTRLSDRARVLPMNADSAGEFLQTWEEAVDVIFMDPPYNVELEKQALDKLRGCDCVTADTLIVAEASLETDFSYLEEFGYMIVKEKRYKTNKHMFIKKRADGAEMRKL
ncbi:MAG: 16S rRNA (guanine(966)-N(2))-methyltransferase RsmD [Lachnospiraceae bacterium]|nr:16S rRNA (guanine(966)-N(2))-methyltransferase RsmD [Lachnospiraceae bacterium]